MSNFTEIFNPIIANPSKWSNTQTIRRQIADELFECVWRFCGIGACKVKCQNKQEEVGGKILLS